MPTMRPPWARRASTAEALTEFDKALAIWPNDPETLLKRGTSLAGLGRLDEAIAGYRAVIALRPDEAIAYLNLGASLAARAEYDEAVAMYRKVLDIQPGSARGVHQPRRRAAPSGQA